MWLTSSKPSLPQPWKFLQMLMRTCCLTILARASFFLNNKILPSNISNRSQITHSTVAIDWKTLSVSVIRILWSKEKWSSPSDSLVESLSDQLFHLMSSLSGWVWMTLHKFYSTAFQLSKHPRIPGKHRSSHKWLDCLCVPLSLITLLPPIP